MSPLDKAIVFAGAFEAELLVMLMMKVWDHPQTGDSDAVHEIVENAAEVLNQSKMGTKFLEELEAEDMNFVAAVWYAETCQAIDPVDPHHQKRQAWLDAIRRAIPSCFCDPDDLV